MSGPKLWPPPSANAQADAEKGCGDQGDGECPDKRRHTVLAGLDHPTQPPIKEIFAVFLWQELSGAVNETSGEQYAASVELDCQQARQKRRNEKKHEPGKRVDLLPDLHRLRITKQLTVVCLLTSPPH